MQTLGKRATELDAWREAAFCCSGMVPVGTKWGFGVCKFFRFGKVLGAALIVSALAGCSSSDEEMDPPYAAPNFCKEENRQIPELEMKGRLLLSIAKKKRLQDDLQKYLNSLAPEHSSDEQKLRALMAYVKKYPLCCQLIYTDLRYLKNPYWHDNLVFETAADRMTAPDYDFQDENIKNGYFANFYIFYRKEEYRIIPDIGIWKPNVLADHLAHSEAASNCGRVL